MPYTPVPKFPTICRELRLLDKSFYEFDTIKKYVMKHTQSIKPNTIKCIVEAMVTLEYLKEENSVFKVCVGEPGQFADN